MPECPFRAKLLSNYLLLAFSVCLSSYVASCLALIFRASLLLFRRRAVSSLLLLSFSFNRHIFLALAVLCSDALCLRFFSSPPPPSSSYLYPFNFSFIFPLFRFLQHLFNRVGIKGVQCNTGITISQ